MNEFSLYKADNISQLSVKELEQLLNDKHDELEQSQESLEKAYSKINELEIENRDLASDLNKAEQILEQCCE